MAAGLSVVGKTNIFIQSEVESDFAAREALLDRAVGQCAGAEGLRRIEWAVAGRQKTMPLPTLTGLGG